MKWLPLAALLSVALFAQAPAFEVATINSSPRASHGNLTSVRIDQSQVRIDGLSLAAILALAFRVHRAQIIGPDWLTTTGFTIVAKIPAGGSASEVPEMLQNLLIDRFRMKVNRETRDLPAYILTAGKRPLPPLEDGTPEITADSAGDNAKVVQTPVGEMKMSTTASGGQIVGSRLRVSLSREGAQLEMTSVATLVKALTADQDLPVVDQTGLTGKYRIALDMRAGKAAPLNPNTPLNRELDAVEEHLGLKVTRGKAPLEAIVINQIEKTPTAN
jgi:uncharacterized protein (TIGR03435 family)